MQEKILTHQSAALRVTRPALSTSERARREKAAADTIAKVLQGYLQRKEKQ